MTHQTERRPQLVAGGIDASGTSSEESLLPSADIDRTQARCRRCGANLSRPESVARQLGPVCRHSVDFDELEAVGE